MKMSLLLALIVLSAVSCGKKEEPATVVSGTSGLGSLAKSEDIEALDQFLEEDLSWIYKMNKSEKETVTYLGKDMKKLATCEDYSVEIKAVKSDISALPVFIYREKQKVTLQKTDDKNTYCQKDQQSELLLYSKADANHAETLQDLSQKNIEKLKEEIIADVVSQKILLTQENHVYKLSINKNLASNEIKSVVYNFNTHRIERNQINNNGSNIILVKNIQSESPNDEVKKILSSSNNMEVLLRNFDHVTINSGESRYNEMTSRNLGKTGEIYYSNSAYSDWENLSYTIRTRY